MSLTAGRRYLLLLQGGTWSGSLTGEEGSGVITQAFLVPLGFWLAWEQVGGLSGLLLSDVPGASTVIPGASRGLLWVSFPAQPARQGSGGDRGRLQLETGGESGRAWLLCLASGWRLAGGFPKKPWELLLRDWEPSFPHLVLVVSAACVGGGVGSLPCGPLCIWAGVPAKPAEKFGGDFWLSPGRDPSPSWAPVPQKHVGPRSGLLLRC